MNCPHCDKKNNWQQPETYQRCVLNQPLMMVIPPGGTHLSCPAHPEGHHVFGTEVRCTESSIESSCLVSKNDPYVMSFAAVGGSLPQGF